MNTISALQGRLSQEQVEHYFREGYTIPTGPIFPEEKYQRLKQHFERKLAALPSDQRPEAMDVPHFTDPALFEWLFVDEILDLVEPIIGPDIALFSSHFICKQKGNGKRVPWHEDSSYWKTMLPASMEVVTVWFAIDPSRRENGCMQVIPRTHNTGKKGFSDYDPVDATRNIFPTEVTKTQRDETRAVAIELEPNHASLHDARIIHGSEPNLSHLRRCGYTMRYMSTQTRLSADASDFHRIYLARGRDLANQTYADPTKVYADVLRYRATHGKNGH
jgi:chlorinating enzyme